MSRLFFATVACMLLAAANDLPGDIIAGFDGGGGSVLVDQYPGVPGNGWMGAWQRHGSGSAGIVDADPLNQGGNYLTASATSGTQGVRRQYGDHGAVGLDRPHTIMFDFRVDVLPAGWGTSTNYRVHVFDSDDPSAVAPQAHSSWMGIVYGSGDRGNWEFANCIGSSTNWVAHDTGIPLAAGELYTFAITVYPGETGPNYSPSVGPTYDLALTHPNGTYVVKGLGLRNDGGPGGYLNWSMVGTSTGATAFSLDSIRIVPEPGAAALLLIGAIYGILRLPRRRRATRSTVHRPGRATAN